MPRAGDGFPRGASGRWSAKEAPPGKPPWSRRPVSLGGAWPTPSRSIPEAGRRVAGGTGWSREPGRPQELPRFGHTSSLTLAAEPHPVRTDSCRGWCFPSRTSGMPASQRIPGPHSVRSPGKEAAGRVVLAGCSPSLWGVSIPAGLSAPGVARPWGAAELVVVARTSSARAEPYADPSRWGACSHPALRAITHSVQGRGPGLDPDPGQTGNRETATEFARCVAAAAGSSARARSCFSSTAWYWPASRKTRPGVVVATVALPQTREAASGHCRCSGRCSPRQQGSYFRVDWQGPPPGAEPTGLH